MTGAVRLVIAAVLLAIVFPSYAQADEFKLIPSVALKEEYNDNILYATDSPTRSWITTVSPGLALTNRTEKLDLMLSALVDIARYHDESTFDSESQYYKGRLGYIFGPRTNIQAEGGWSRDYRPDRDIYTSGISLDNTGRDRGYGGLSGNWAISERWTAGANYYYENEQYDNPAYSDMEGHQVGLGFYRMLGPVTKGRVNGGYTRYSYSTSDYDGGWATVGVEHTYHELWTIIVDAGARYARTKYRTTELQFVPPFFLVPVNVDKTSEEWGGVGRASINYKGEKTNFALSASYDIAPASGRDGPVERTAFIFDIRHRLTYEFSAALTTGYFLNYAAAGQYGQSAIDEQTFAVRPSLRYEFTQDLYLEVAYDFATTDYKNADTNAQRNLVFVRLYAQYPLFE